MYGLTKKFPFEAAHRLPNHDGKCARLHGHSYVLTIECAEEVLCSHGAKRGMLVDFYVVRQVVQPIVDQYLDHHYLNETLGFEDTTSENIAKWVFDKISPLLPVKLHSVRVSETCTSEVTYTP